MTTQEGEADGGMGWGTEKGDLSSRVWSFCDCNGLGVILTRSLKPELTREVNGDCYSKMTGKPAGGLHLGIRIRVFATYTLSCLLLVHGKLITGNKDLCKVHGALRLKNVLADPCQRQNVWAALWVEGTPRSVVLVCREHCVLLSPQVYKNSQVF